MHGGSTRTRRRTWGALAVLALGAATLSALASPAEATTITYAGTSSGTQSTVVIHQGDAYQRTLHPTGSLTAVLDDTAGKVVSGQVTLAPTYTDTFTGPFGLQLYVRTDMEQVGSATGTATPSATEGITALSVNATTRLRLTVYRTLDGTQHPATDSKLTDPVKCWVDVPMALTGTANRRSGDLSLGQTGFTIPTFPNGSPDPNRTCGLATGSLNAQVAGSKNAITLGFSGGPTSAHYTGVTSGTQSSISIKKGSLFFAQTVNPSGSLTADIDFTTGAVTNTVARFNPITMKAFPGVLSQLPVLARIDLTTLGTPTAKLSPSGTAGIDSVAVQTTTRMGVTVYLADAPTVKLTNGSTCYVDIPLSLKGTVDRGTDKLALGQSPFTIPSFGSGCGLLASGLTLLVSGPNNSISLSYVDGVVAP